MEDQQTPQPISDYSSPDASSNGAAATPPAHAAVYSGLSGNEMYCVDLLGYAPGDLLVGNSVFSMGILGSIKSVGRGLIGGEIKSYTDMIQQGRRLSYVRLLDELTKSQGAGVSGVSSELVLHGGNIEFLSIGSALHPKKPTGQKQFTTSFDGQELFSLVDAKYQPQAFVFGNVAYSIGIGKGITGAFRKLAKGEVRQYSDIFTNTRQLALDRIVQEAKDNGANAVMGIRTSIVPYGTSGVQEMVMVGTAAVHDNASSLNNKYGVITSDLTAEESWNVAKLGYMPVQLVLGTSVYSLGVIGGFQSFFKGMVRGEIGPLTQMIYGAREESIRKLQQQATELGADDVLGIKTYIYQLGGALIEFLAIGTAVKKVPGVDTTTGQLPVQAIIKDKDTFTNLADLRFGLNLNNQNN